MEIPPGFDVAIFINTLFGFAEPFVGIAALFFAGRLVNRIITRRGK